MPRKQKSSSALRFLFSVPSVLKFPLSPSLTRPLAAVFISSTMLLIPARAQDKTPPMSMNQQMHHHHGDVPLVAPQYPRMGRAQENADGQLVTLEQVEKLAAETNPTLR